MQHRGSVFLSDSVRVARAGADIHTRAIQRSGPQTDQSGWLTEVKCSLWSMILSFGIGNCRFAKEKVISSCEVGIMEVPEGGAEQKCSG